MKKGLGLREGVRVRGPFEPVVEPAGAPLHTVSLLDKQPLQYTSFIAKT